MAIKLSALRVSSEIDSAGYTRGMNAIKEANRSGADSVKAAGAALAQMDVALGRTGSGAAKLSKQLITGYTDGSKFESKMADIERMLNKGLSADRAATLIDALSRKFSLVGDAAVYAAKGMVKLAPIVDEVNRALEEQAKALADVEKAIALASETERLTQKFDGAKVSSDAFRKELGDLNDAEWLGVKIANGYTNELNKLIVKYDQAGAAAIKYADKIRTANKAASDKFIAQTSAYTPANSMIIGMSEAGRLANQVEELRRRFDPLYVSTQKYRSELTLLNDAQRKGAIDSEVYYARLGELNRALSANAVAARASAAATAATYTAEYQRAIDKSLGHNQGSAMDNGAGFDAIIAEAERLRVRFDASSVAADNFAQSQKDLKRALDWNIISIDAYEKQLRDLEVAYHSVYIASRKQAEKGAAEYAEAYQGSINRRLGVGQTPATENGAGGDQFAIEAENLRRQFDPAYVAAERFKEQISQLRQAQMLGVDISVGYIAALDRITAEYHAGEIAAGRMSAAVVSLSSSQKTISAGFASMGTGSTGAYDTREANRLASARLGNMNPEQTARNTKAENDAKKSAAEMAQQYKLLRLEIDPVGASQDRLTESLARFKSMQDAGVLSNREYTQAVENENRKHEETIRINQRAGKELGLQQHQYANLGYQVNDIISGLAMGQSPFMILTQQGGQVLQILQSGDGGILPTLKRMATFIGTQLLRPVVGLTTAFVALGAAATYAFFRFESSQDKLAASLTGIGRAAGLTLDGLNRVADAGARASTGAISGSTARGLAAQFTGTGKITGGMMIDLISQAKEYARITGQDIPAAGAELAKAFADPAQGAEDLDKKFGFLDGRTRLLIKTLTAQGQVLEAQEILFAKVGQATTGAENRLWSWRVAWDAIIASISNGADAAARALQKLIDPSIQQRYESLLRLQAGAGEQAREKTGNMRGAPGGRIRGLPDTEAVPYTPGGRTGNMRGEPAAKAQADRQRAMAQTQLDDLNEQLRRQQQLAAERARALRLNEASKIVDDTVATAVPEQTRFDDLTNRVQKLSLVMGEGGASLAGRGQLAQEAMDRLRGALASLTDVNGKVLTQSDLLSERFGVEVDSIKARTLAEYQDIAARKESMSLRGQEMTQKDRDLEIDRQKQLIQEQANREGQDRLRTAEASLKASSMLPYQQQRQGVYDKYRDILERGGNNAKDVAAMNAELATLQRNNVEKPIDDANMALNAQILTMKKTADSFGLTIDKSTAMMEMQRLLNEAQRQGIVVTDELRASYQALADRTGQAAKDQENLTYAMGKVNSAMSEIHETSNDVFGGLAKALAHGTSLSDALKESLGRIADKMIDSGVNEITNGLFGDPAKQGDKGGLGGPIFDYLKKSWRIGSGAVTTPLKDVVTNTASMTVTAASVTVNTPGAIQSGPLPAAATGAIPGLPGVVYTGTGAAAALASSVTSHTGVAAASQMQPQQVAMLNAIAATESAGKYNVRYGGVNSPGKYFDVNGPHPNILETTKTGEKSSASGRYEFTGTTWRGLGGGTMLPVNQDVNAWKLAQRDYSARGGGDLSADLQKGGLTPDILRKLGPTWAGLRDNPAAAKSAYSKTLSSYNDIPQSANDNAKLQNQDVMAGQFGANSLIGASTSVDKLADSAKDLAANANKATPALTDASKGFGDLSGSLGNLFGGIGAAIGGKGGGAWGGLLGGALGKLIGGIGGTLFGGGAPIMGTAGLFADGGIMSSHGRLPVNYYAEGGIADKPQAAIFGEGRQNEAYVPLGKGRSIPVVMRGGAQDKRVGGYAQGGKPVSVVFGGTTVHIAGDASEQTVALIDQKVSAANAGLLNHVNRNLITMVRSSQANYGN